MWPSRASHKAWEEPAQFSIGLHTKAVVADRKYVFIGSMNFDPRSANINTDGGASSTVRSWPRTWPKVMLRDMQPESAWQVKLDHKGKPYWINRDETVHRQPARGPGQRLIFQMFPKSQY